MEAPAQPAIDIPFNRSSLVGRELEYVALAIAGGQIAGDQVFTQKCRALLEEVLGPCTVMMTPSCTHALEMAALLLDIQPGDEVIVPSFTFVSTINAFVLRGAKPIFADIRPDTLNLDEHALEAKITPRTRAIVPVHYAGVACEMDAILKIAKRHRLAVVEDNAHGLFGRYKDRPLGSFGCLATQSFHETKNFTCGEGGALVINDPALVERAEIIREKGTNRTRFFRGEIHKYSWVDLGSSYLMSDLLAAFLLGQLEERDKIQARRQRLWESYDRRLLDWRKHTGARGPIVPAHCQHPHHLYYLLLPTLEKRQGLIAHLKSRGIRSVFHYVPLHLSEKGMQFGSKPGDCPVTEDISDRLLRLPLYYDLTEEKLDRVIDAVQAFH